MSDSTIKKRVLSIYLIISFITIGFIGIIIFPNTATAAGTYINGNINTNTTWSTSGSPYILTNDITVEVSATLTIKPGVLVKFDEGTELIIEGNLTAIGTFGSRITFCPNYTKPYFRMWRGIIIKSTSQNTTMEYCVIQECYTGIHAVGTDVKIIDCEIKDCNDAGLRLSNGCSKSIIKRIHSENNRYGIKLDNSAPDIVRCTIKNSWEHGLYLVSCVVDIHNTKILSSIKIGVVALWASVYLYNCTISGSGAEDLSIGSYALNCWARIMTINTLFSKSKVTFRGNPSSLTVRWYLHVYVKDSNNSPVQGVNVLVKGYKGYERLKSITDTNGYVRWIELTEYYQGSITQKNYYSPYYVYAWNNTHGGNNFCSLSSSKTVRITLQPDSSPPTTTIVPGIPNYRANHRDNFNVTLTTTFTISAIDNESGVDLIQYKIDNNSWSNYTYPFNLNSVGNGTHKIYFKSSDYIGNNESEKQIEVFVDDTSPKSWILIDNPKYREKSSDIWNVTSKTKFHIIHNNDSYESGLAFSWFKLDGGPSKTFSGSFNILDGTNLVEWGCEDNVGNNEMGNQLIISVDDKVPNNNITISTPKYRFDPQNDWNITSLTRISLNSTDFGTGIISTLYRIDSGLWVNYTDDLNLSNYSDGQHIIQFNSTDKLSNYNFTTMNLINDNSEPKTIVKVGYPKYRTINSDIWNVTTSTQFTLQSNDTYSGVKITKYKLDNGNWYNYTKPFNLTALGIGKHTIYFNSTDNLMNFESTKSITVFIDDTFPSTIINIGEPSYGSNPTYLTTNSVISFTHNNDLGGVGVDFIWYKLNFGAPQFYSTPFTVPVGTSVVEWGAVDLLGNNETGNLLNIFGDDSPPITTIEIGDPKTEKDITFITPTTPISFSHDNDLNGVGLDYIWYQIDDSEIKIYSDPITVQVGAKNIKWGGIDLLGNNETGRSIEIYVDNESPKTNLEIGHQKYGNDTIYVTTTTKFKLKHNNDGIGTGIAYCWYRFNDGNSKIYSKSFTVPIGTTTIEWGSEDNLGNKEVNNSISVIIDDIEPVTSIKIGKPNYRTEQQLITSLTEFTLIVEEIDSGIAVIYYKIDYSHDWKSYTRSFTIPDDGAHTIYFYSVDNVGNIEQEKSLNLYVDNTPPEIPELISLPSLTKESKITIKGEAEPNCVIDFYLNSDFIISTNSGSNGIIEIDIMLKEGKNEITVTATDVFNRTSDHSSTQTVILDTTSPKIIETFPIKNAKDVNTNTNIVIIFSESMDQSSVESGFLITPSINGEFFWDDNKLIFKSNMDYSYITKYYIQVDSDVTDLVGNALEETYLWKFITVDDPEVIIDVDQDGYPDEIDAFPKNPTQWLDSDGDNFGDNLNGNNPDVFPNDPTEWFDSDGDNYGDNIDLYPEDPIKWEKEDEKPDIQKEQVKKTKKDNIAVLGMAIFIIILLIIFILLLFMYFKKNSEK